MSPAPLPALRLDTQGVGGCTVAVSELLDLRRVLAFAAAVGAGASRMSAQTPDCEPCPHPAFAFALQFMAQRRLDVAPSSDPAWLSAVHAESDLRIVQPFRLGDVITTQGQLIARRQIKPGVLNVERYRMHDGQGRLCAELDYHLIFRGARLTGEERVLAPIPDVPAIARRMGAEGSEGADAPARVILHQMALHEALHVYTACSGIHAAIHTDRRAALQAGFADIILHGSATKAFALTAVIDTVLDGDPTRVRRVRGRLRAAITAGSAFRVMLRGRSPLGRGADGVEEEAIGFEVLNEAGEQAVSHGLVIAAGPRGQ